MESNGLTIKGEKLQSMLQKLLERIPAAPPNYCQLSKKNLKGDFSDINPIEIEAGANRCAIT